MKIVKTASGKQTLKLSRKEWQAIGKKAGWVKTAWGSVYPVYEKRYEGDPSGEVTLEMRTEKFGVQNRYVDKRSMWASPQDIQKKVNLLQNDVKECLEEAGFSADQMGIDPNEWLIEFDDKGLRLAVYVTMDFSGEDSEKVAKFFKDYGPWEAPEPFLSDEEYYKSIGKELPNPDLPEPAYYPGIEY